MIVRVDGRQFEGDAIDVPGGDPRRIARAVADESVAGVTVEAPDPGAVVREVSPVTPGVSLSVGTALAAAARSRGHEAPQDEALARVRDELASLDAESVDAAPARRRVAEVDDRERKLHERVAELRGRLAAHREREEGPPADLEKRLRASITELTEVRTERLAAEEAVERAERRARRTRDRRERRLGLVDRRDNLRRAAREHLIGQVGEAFVDAVHAVPGPDPDPGVGPRAVPDEVSAALATVRLATVSAPVVVACDRFSSAEAAATTLSAPAIRLPTG